MPDTHETRASDATAPDVPAPARAGVTTVYLTLLRWTLSQVGAMLPLIIVVQTFLAAGIVIGFGFLIPDIDSPTARFVSTGAPTVLLLVIGLVLVPQGVARARIDGTFMYMRSLPVPRPLLLLTDLTVWLLIGLPSVAVGVAVAWLRYDIAFSFDWPLLVATTLLVTTMATAVGYAIAVSMPPLLAQLLTQALVFFVLLFSPITFPVEQLPEWFQTVHDYLPARPAADLLRAGLVSDVFDARWRDLLVLAAWCAAGVGISLRALVRRG